MRRWVFITSVCLLLGGWNAVPVAAGHAGGLDARGCHHDRTNGDYHCHQGPLAGRSFLSEREAAAALAGPSSTDPGTPAARTWRTVVRVIDGDTILLDGGERVRLIGVDTPESVDPRRPVEFFGQEAAAFTIARAEGRRVYCEYDRERQDQYGRTLAYVFLEDGTFLNAEIIRQGFGFALTRFPFRYLEEFRQYEREAREAGRGLWADR